MKNILKEIYTIRKENKKIKTKELVKILELEEENNLLKDMHDKLCREITRLNKRKGK
tara:strand:- start:592 stop:762 length:171 start_codon:yes stop_codon:yes gene_type:complete